MNDDFKWIVKPYGRKLRESAYIRKRRKEMRERGMRWKRSGREGSRYSYPFRYENHNAFLIIVGGKVESVGI